MNYLHDVHVNWVDGGSRKHEIPEYFEWKEGDPEELMETLPLVIIKHELFTILEDGYVDIPKDLLSMVHRVAVKINPVTKRKNKVEYCFAVTDGVRVVVINTEGDNMPNLKSRIAPDRERFALELAEEYPKYTFEIPSGYTVEEHEDVTGFFSTSPKDYVGLTRTEKEMKQIVLDCLFNLSGSDNKFEVFYWFVEVFPELNSQTTLAALSKEEMVQHLFDFLRKGWSKCHEEFGTNMIKVAPNDIYKDEWVNLLKEKKVNKDKVNN